MSGRSECWEGVPTWVRVAWLLDRRVEKKQRKKQRYLQSRAGCHRAEGLVGRAGPPEGACTPRGRRQLARPCPRLRWFLASQVVPGVCRSPGRCRTVPSASIWGL